MAFRRWWRFPTTVSVLLVLIVLLLTACADDDEQAESAADSDADAVERFCAEALDPSVEVPESYVGSDEHVDDLHNLRSLAPAELHDDLDVVIEHFDAAVDPADPDSQLTENFPNEVNSAIDRVTRYIQANCDNN